MIDLTRHIEVLLLKHDCVVVPSFGGFVVQYVPAHYVPEEQSLVPPHRTVSFNAQLTWDDGLIVQSCMQTADCSYPEAVKLVRRSVDELKQTLTSQKNYDFSGIGKLNISESGLLEFIPNEAGVASPTLYGLEVLSCPVCHSHREGSEFSISTSPVNVDECNKDKAVGTVTEVAVATPAAGNVEGKSIHKSRNYTLNVNRELVNYIAAAVVAVIFYFLWVTPIGFNSSAITSETTSHSTTTNCAQMFPSPVTSNVSTGASKEQDVQENAPRVAQTERVNEPTTSSTTDKDSKDVEEKPQETKSTYFAIILVSSVTRHNAEKYVETLHQAGFDEAKVLAKPRMVRVAYGQYATESEAYHKLRKLRADKRFRDAWVMKISD